LLIIDNILLIKVLFRFVGLRMLYKVSDVRFFSFQPDASL